MVRYGAESKGKKAKSSLDSGMSDLQDRLAFLENRLKMLDDFTPDPLSDTSNGQHGQYGAPAWSESRHEGPQFGGSYQQQHGSPSRAPGPVSQFGASSNRGNVGRPSLSPTKGRGGYESSQASGRLPYRTTASDFLGPDFAQRFEAPSVGGIPPSSLTSYVSDPPPLRSARSPPRQANIPQTYSPEAKAASGKGLGELSNLHAVLQEIKRDLGGAPASSSPMTLSSAAANQRSSPTRDAPLPGQPGYSLLSKGRTPVKSKRESPPHRAFRLLGLLPEPDDDPREGPRPLESWLPASLQQQYQEQLEQRQRYGEGDEDYPPYGGTRSPIKDWQPPPSHLLEPHVPHSAAPQQYYPPWQPQYPPHAMYPPHQPQQPYPPAQHYANGQQYVPPPQPYGRAASPPRAGELARPHMAGAGSQVSTARSGGPVPQLQLDHLHSTESPLPPADRPAAYGQAEGADAQASVFTPQRSARSLRSDLTDLLSGSRQMTSSEVARGEAHAESRAPLAEPRREGFPEEPYGREEPHDAYGRPQPPYSSEAPAYGDAAGVQYGNDYERAEDVEYGIAKHEPPPPSYAEEQRRQYLGGAGEGGREAPVMIADLQDTYEGQFGASDPVGVRLRLEEDYEAAMTNAASRNRFQRLLEDELCDGLGLPRGRVQVAGFEGVRGGMIANTNIWPDPTGAGASPALLADELARQVNDPGSKVMRSISMRRAVSAAKGTPFIGEMEQDYSEPSPTRLGEAQHAQKIAMFKKFEKAGARIPAPGAPKNSSDPHFSAPKAAKDSHAHRTTSLGGPGGERSRNGGSMGMDESSLPNITSATDVTHNDTRLDSPDRDVLGQVTNDLTLASPWSEADTPSYVQNEQKPTPRAVGSTPPPDRPNFETPTKLGSAGEDEDSEATASASKFGVRLKRVGERSSTSLLRADSGGLNNLSDGGLGSPSASQQSWNKQPSPSPRKPSPRVGQAWSRPVPIDHETTRLPSSPKITSPKISSARPPTSPMGSSVMKSVSDWNKGGPANEPPSPRQETGEVLPLADEGASAAGGEEPAPAPEAPLSEFEKSAMALLGDEDEDEAEAAAAEDEFDPAAFGLTNDPTPQQSQRSGETEEERTAREMEEFLRKEVYNGEVPAGTTLAERTPPGSAAAQSEEHHDENLTEEEERQRALQLAEQTTMPHDLVASPTHSALDRTPSNLAPVSEDQVLDEPLAADGSRGVLAADSDREGDDDDYEERDLTAEEVGQMWNPRPVLPVQQKQHDGVVLRSPDASHTSILADPDPLLDKDKRPTCLGSCWGAFFSWGWGLVSRVEHEALRDGEALRLPAMPSCDEWHEELNEELGRHRSAKSSALDEDAILKAVAAVAGRRHVLPWVLLVVWVVTGLACIVLCLRELLVWVGDCPAFATMSQLDKCTQGINLVEREPWEGAVLVTGMFLAILFQSFALHHHLHQCAVGVMGASSALMSIIYSKAVNSLGFGNDEFQDPNGESAQSLSNVLLNDVNDILIGEMVRRLRWAALACSMGAVGLMIREVEIPGILALPVVLIVLSLQWFMLRLVDRRRQHELSEMAETRTQSLLEFLSNFEVIKYLHISDIFARGLTQAREVQLGELSKALMMKAVLSAVILATPAMVNAIVVTLHRAPFEGRGSGISVFVVLALAACVQAPLSLITLASTLDVRKAKAVRRILSMLQTEARPDPPNVPIWQPTEPPIIVQKAAFFLKPIQPRGALWLGLENQPLDLCVQRGTLTGILSDRGAGRTSLLKAMAGLFPANNGKVELRGSVCYVMQAPQLLVGSVRQNVLFGLPFDKNMYARALDCTFLAQLVQALPKGDQTIVGPGKEAHPLTVRERYLVSLARAIYADGDIYMLDGMFEALGDNEGTHVWRATVLGQLKAKTVVVTGPMPRECMLHCNSVIYLAMQRGQNGVAATVEVGTPPQLSERGVPLPIRARTDQPVDCVCTLRRLPWVATVQTSAEQRAILSLNTPPPWGLASYLRSGGVPGVIFGCIVALIAQAALTASDYWLINLAYLPALRGIPPGFPATIGLGFGLDNTILVLWMLILGGLILATGAASIWYMLTVGPASVSLHDRLLAAIVRGSPLQALTPRLRHGLSSEVFGAHLGVADELLPESLQHAAQFFLAALGAMTILTIELCFLDYRRGSARQGVIAHLDVPVQIFAIAPGLVLIAVAWLCYKANRAIRCMSHLGAGARSAVHAMCFATSDSLGVMAVSAARPRFVTTMQELIDAKVRADLAVRGVQRWVGLRVDFCSALFVAGVGTAVVLLKLSGYFPNAADFEGEVATQFGVSGVASAGLALACAVQAYIWLQWAVFCGADAVAHLHRSAHTLVTAAHIICPPEEDTMQSFSPMAQIRGDIEFKGVSVARGCATVLRDLNVHLAVGQKVLLFGGSDSGKTSVALALVRALVPRPGGKIVLGGVDISQIPLPELRRLVAYVPTEPILFRGTFLYNVDPHGRVDKAEILPWLKSVGIVPPDHTTIPSNLTDEPDILKRSPPSTRQLVCIVRSIIRRPAVLIMDELLATLATESYDRLDQLLLAQPHTTVIQMSRSVRRVSSASHFLKLEAGEVVEYGRTSDLLANKESGLYREVKALGPEEAQAVRDELAKNGAAMAAIQEGQAMPAVVQQQQAPAVHAAGVMGLQQQQAPAQGMVMQGQAPGMVIQQPPPGAQPTQPHPSSLNLVHPTLVTYLQNLPEDYLFDLARGSIALLHASLQVEPASARSTSPEELQMLRDGLFTGAVDWQNVEAVIRQACQTRVEQVSSLTNSMTTLVALCYHILAAVPRPIVSREFVAQITSPEIETLEGNAKAGAIGNIIQANLDASGDYLELFVQFVWLLWNVTLVSQALSAEDMARKIGPLIMREAVPSEQAVMALQVLIARYDKIFEGQVTYGDSSQQNTARTQGTGANGDDTYRSQGGAGAGVQQPASGHVSAPVAVAQGGGARVSLHDALLSGELGQVVAALQQPHDINERNEDTFTVLMVAAAMGRHDIVSELLNGGADPFLTEGQGLNAVHLTTLGRQPAGQYPQVLEMLLKRSTPDHDLANTPTAFNDFPLHFCASMSAEEELLEQALTMANVLRMYGADTTKTNGAGHTALQIANDSNVPRMVQILQTNTGWIGARSPSVVPMDNASVISQPMSNMPSPIPKGASRVSGALQEGKLHLLNKKKKEWDEVYYAIVPTLRDSKGSGHGDFAYMLSSWNSREDAGMVPALDMVNLYHAEVKLLTGTVFSLKSSPEVSKSRTHRISADSLNELRTWLLSFELVPDVSVDWTDAEGNTLDRTMDPLEGAGPLSSGSQPA